MTRTPLAVAWCAVLLCCDSFGSNTPDGVSDAGADGQTPEGDGSAPPVSDPRTDAGDGGAPVATGAFCSEQKGKLADKLLGCADFDSPSFAFTETSNGLELSRVTLDSFGREPAALFVSGSRDGNLMQGGLQHLNVPAPASGKTVSLRFLMKLTTLESTNSGSAGVVNVVGILAAGASEPFLTVQLVNPDADPGKYRAAFNTPANSYPLSAIADKTMGVAVPVEVNIRREGVNGVAFGGSVGPSNLPPMQLFQDESVKAWTVYVGAELNQGKAKVAVALDDVVIATD